MQNASEKDFDMPYNADISLLIVENDKSCLDIFQSIVSLRFPKLIVHTAFDPAEAIAKYQDYRHNIVITDLFAPQKHGLVIAKKVCETNPQTVVIFITADTDTVWDTLKHKAKRLCLEGMLHKPIDLKEVIDKLTEAIGIINMRTQGK